MDNQFQTCKIMQASQARLRNYFSGREEIFPHTTIFCGFEVYFQPSFPFCAQKRPTLPYFRYKMAIIWPKMAKYFGLNHKCWICQSFILRKFMFGEVVLEEVFSFSARLDILFPPERTGKKENSFSLKICHRTSYKQTNL